MYCPGQQLSTKSFCAGKQVLGLALGQEAFPSCCGQIGQAIGRPLSRLRPCYAVERQLHFQCPIVTGVHKNTYQFTLGLLARSLNKEDLGLAFTVLPGHSFSPCNGSFGFQHEQHDVLIESQTRLSKPPQTPCSEVQRLLVWSLHLGDKVIGKQSSCRSMIGSRANSGSCMWARCNDVHHAKTVPTNACNGEAFKGFTCKGGHQQLSACGGSTLCNMPAAKP